MADVYVAAETAIVEYDGSPVRIKKGVTRVEEGHALLEAHPGLFKPVADGIQFAVRDARSTDSVYDKMKVEELRATIEARNVDREDGAKLSTEGKKADLIATLATDDQAHTEA